MSSLTDLRRPEVAFKVFIRFIRYNGMPAEQIAMAWLRSELLLCKPLPYLKGGATR